MKMDCKKRKTIMRDSVAYKYCWELQDGVQ